MSLKMPIPYAGIQLCGVTPEDIKVEIRRDGNGAGHLTIKVAGNSVAFTLSSFSDAETDIVDIARDLSRKITDAIVNLPVRRSCPICFETKLLTDSGLCSECVGYGYSLLPVGKGTCAICGDVERIGSGGVCRSCLPAVPA